MSSLRTFLASLILFATHAEACINTYEEDLLNPDPIITATYALVTGDTDHATRLYHEAMEQNVVYPDERSYEWRLPLLLRLYPGVDAMVAGHLENCKEQALRADDQDAVARIDAMLASMSSNSAIPPMRRRQLLVTTTAFMALVGTTAT